MNDSDFLDPEDQEKAVEIRIMVYISAVLCLIIFCNSSMSNAASQAGQVIVDPSAPSHLVYNRDNDNNGRLDPVYISGAGDPENFFFRGVRQTDGTRVNGGQDSLIHKMINLGGNGIYIMAVRSHGGDGGVTENPFIDSDPTKGIDNDILDQWEEWLTLLDDNGIIVYFIIYDDHSRIWRTGDNVGTEETEFVKTLVNRFKHHRHLIWCIAEEYFFAMSIKRVKNLAALIRATDDYSHPIAVGQRNGDNTMDFPADINIDIFGQQANARNVNSLYDDVATAYNDANGRFATIMGEAYPWHGDLVKAGNRDTLRKSLWSVGLAGAAGGLVFGVWNNFNPQDPTGVPTDDMLRDWRRQQLFFESTMFNEMKPNNDLIHGDTKWALAKDQESYILYSDENPRNLGVRDLAVGDYLLRWFDPVDGDEVNSKEKVKTFGNHVFDKPSNIDAEAVLYITSEKDLTEPAVPTGVKVY